MYRDYGDMHAAAANRAEYEKLAAEYQAAVRKADDEKVATEAAARRELDEEDRRQSALRALGDRVRQRYTALRQAVQEYDDAEAVYEARRAAVPDLNELLVQIKRQQDLHLRELDRMQAQQRQWASVMAGDVASAALTRGASGAGGSGGMSSAGSATRRTATTGRPSTRVGPGVR